MITSPYIAPVAYPVSLVEAKLHLRVDNTTDDGLITSLIGAATEWCEKYEGHSYMMQSYKVYLDGFYNVVYLPHAPLVSVSSVQYYDGAGDLQTLATSYYTVDTDSTPGRVYLAYNQNWPSTYLIPKSVIITYTAGYATTFTAVAATNVCTVGNAVFANGDTVRVVTDQSDLPSPLAVGTNYYVGDVSGSTLKLYTDSGLASVVDILDTGTPTHMIGFADRGLVPSRAIAAIKLLIGHLYEHREQASEVTLQEIPFAVANLLNERTFA